MKSCEFEIHLRLIYVSDVSYVMSPSGSVKIYIIYMAFPKIEMRLIYFPVGDA